MSVVVVPLPISRIDPPERCLVTGQTEGVELRAAPMYGLLYRKPLILPLTEEGRARVASRTHRAGWMALGVLLAGIGISVVLSLLVPGEVALLGMLAIVIGWIGVRSWRQRELHALSRRGDVATLVIPRDEVARDLREAIDAADLTEDMRETIAGARRLGELEASRHPVAR